ncbi:PTS transporter subunit EIIC [Vibrio sp. S17_S38]|uniref:PTS transporter subunit EIIC n=1 Tax=Vibrio sp. S17_S38 TaxID=2720229 RepID=UPI0016805AA5|nr:PTS transporter subunit EIIC [Vibrio sp. S17_S38]MBD1574254.1 PTS transporter subunit EIIC [Vibrio sp. S17_S38]
MSLLALLSKPISKLSLIGRSLMLPISILPAAGLLLAFGDKFNLPLMTNAGGVLFDNLALLFAVGSAVGLAKESGIAALAAVVAMLVLNGTMGTSLGITPEMAAEGGRYAMVMGIPTLQTGVFGGLIAGVLAAVTFNKFHKIKLPEFLGFFSGKRFVPIATAFFAFILGLLLPSVWVYIQSGIDSLSVVVNGENQAISTFIFGMTERALIPLGLHHIWYPSFWFTFGNYTTEAGQIIHGDQTIWFKMFEDGVKSFDSSTYHGAGKFMQGEFPLMLFALPAACLAMYHEAKSNQKKIAAGILFSAALTCFLTGITEPVEFAFIFVSPVLYVFNAIMAGVSYMSMYLLDVHIAKSFSAGLIDYISFGILPSLNGYQTHYLNVILFGVPMGILYYVVFRFVIRKFDVKTVGREDKMRKEITLDDKDLTALIINHVGGKQNILSSAACITRLRLEVKDQSQVDSAALEDLGAMGVIMIGSSGVQVILGAKAQFVSDIINES